MACSDGGGKGGQWGGTTVPGMHDLSQPLHSLCFSIVESGATEGVWHAGTGVAGEGAGEWEVCVRGGMNPFRTNMLTSMCSSFPR